jgi:hypothetical protein
MLILASETAIIISVPTGHHLQMQTTFAKIFDQYDQELPTPIHVDLLAKYLSGYDKTEKEYILQGFSKGFTVFSAISDTQVQCRNLQSALLRPGIVAEKIQTELGAGRFAGPFYHPPLPKFHVSPLGLCPKKEPNKFRVIHHLSYPKGGSVNDFISSEYSSVQYSRIQDAISAIKMYQSDVYLAKCDIEMAYRNLPLSPNEYHKFGFIWDNQFYYDKCLAMGCASSCQIFERLSTSLEWIGQNRYSRGCCCIF